MVTQKHDLHTRVKTCDLQTLPRLCFESERDKKERLTSISLLDVCFVSSCRIAEFSFFVQGTFVLSGNVCFMFLVGERFAYPAYDD